jgi:hypothetical protein
MLNFFRKSDVLFAAKNTVNCLVEIVEIDASLLNQIAGGGHMSNDDVVNEPSAGDPRNKYPFPSPP